MAPRCFQVSVTGAKNRIGANPLRSGRRKRTKESIATVRHLYLGFDIDGKAQLTSLRASEAIAKLTAFISTSPGKYQILWRVDGFTLEQQESALKLLATTFGGDPTCTDCNRVLRLPGFRNCKYDPTFRITVEYPCDSTSNPGDFRLDIAVPDDILASRSITAQKHPANRTNSETDWAWVLHELALAKDGTKLTGKPASRRAYIPNLLCDAQRTGNVASAGLWLIEGVAIDDVVTMLELRRRFEIPVALCSARPRKIALTAQGVLPGKRF